MFEQLKIKKKLLILLSIRIIYYAYAITTCKQYYKTRMHLEVKKVKGKKTEELVQELGDAEVVEGQRLKGYITFCCGSLF